MFLVHLDYPRKLLTPERHAEANEEVLPAVGPRRDQRAQTVELFSGHFAFGAIARTARQRQVVGAGGSPAGYRETVVEVGLIELKGPKL